jgi:hypothetical protein
MFIVWRYKLHVLLKLLYGVGCKILILSESLRGCHLCSNLCDNSAYNWAVIVGLCGRCKKMIFVISRERSFTKFLIYLAFNLRKLLFRCSSWLFVSIKSSKSTNIYRHLLKMNVLRSQFVEVLMILYISHYPCLYSAGYISRLYTAFRDSFLEYSVICWPDISGCLSLGIDRFLVLSKTYLFHFGYLYTHSSVFNKCSCSPMQWYFLLVV